MTDHLDQQERDYITAGCDMLRRTGVREVQIRYADDQEPVIWFVVGTWERNGRLIPQVGADFTPRGAMFALLERVMDGGTCQHCKRPVGVEENWGLDLSGAINEIVCWYVYDPELKTFRRGCE